jgi:hypothetical protein
MSSPYYPPRASWQSGVYKFFSRLAYLNRAERFLSGTEISGGQALRSVLVPGYSFKLVGRKTLARCILLAWGAVGVIFLAMLGYSAANIPFGLMVALHMTGLIQLYRCLFVDASFKRRLAFAFCGALGVFVCYQAILDVVERIFVLPMNVNGQVVVINRLARTGNVKRGDIVAYSIEAARFGNIRFREGYGYAAVLGVAGDQIEFKPRYMAINGQMFSRTKLMPQDHSLTVPENCWFIWSDFHISIYGSGPEEYVKAGLLKAAIVPEGNFIGRPFKYWFGRKQTYP